MLHQNSIFIITVFTCTTFTTTASTSVVPMFGNLAGVWVGSNGTSKEQDVGLGIVLHVIFPTPRLMHAKTAPLIFRHQSSSWDRSCHITWQDDVSILVKIIAILFAVSNITQWHRVVRFKNCQKKMWVGGKSVSNKSLQKEGARRVVHLSILSYEQKKMRWCHIVSDLQQRVMPSLVNGNRVIHNVNRLNKFLHADKTLIALLAPQKLGPLIPNLSKPEGAIVTCRDT
jgi:hypothetical protein